MLERILNIGPDVSHKEKSRTNSYESYIKKPQISKVFGNDAVIFSPAAVFLSKINWIPKDINALSDEKISLSFFLGDFEFSTQIDFSVFYKEVKHKINVYKLYTDRGNKKKSLLKIEFVKDRIRILDEAEKINLSALNKLYDKIIDLHINSELDGNNIQIINSLLDSLHKELYKEFDYIFATVMTFVAKLGKYKVINNFRFPATYDDLIKIDRIVTIDA